MASARARSRGSGPGAAVPWHAEPLGNGGTRVQVGSWAWEEEDGPLTLTFEASAREAGATGPLDLPRVRPASGPRVVDEVWVATPGDGFGIRPILARGLAWVDPPDPARDEVPAPWAAVDLGGALAWRWLAEDAEARIVRSPPRSDPSGEVTLGAAIRGDRLTLGWTVQVEARGDLPDIPIHVEDQPADVPIRWGPGDAGGPIVRARPLDEARRAALGFPPTGQSWELELLGTTRGRIKLEGRADRTWPGRGPLPILTLPARYRASGLVALDVGDSARAKAEPTGLTPIVPESAAVVAPVERDAEAPAGSGRMRRAGTFQYGPTGGRLVVETTSGRPGEGGPWIREAFLNSQFFPGAGARHRLTLRLAPDIARPLTLTMPRGVTTDRIRRDGQAVAAVPEVDAVRLDIPAPEAGRPTCTLTIDYRTDDNPGAGPLDPSRILPTVSAPCLAFAWEVVAPAHWAPAGEARGLEATDLRPASVMIGRLLGFPTAAWPWPWPAPVPSVPTAEGMIKDLDEAATQVGEGAPSLGEWLLKLDAGRWPLVVDRLALRSAGCGPGSRLGATSTEAGPLGPVGSVLRPMGLAAIPAEGTILITAREDSAARAESRDARSRGGFRSVPADGSDATGRFQSPARWRGESTPKAMGAGESADRMPGPGDWRAWRYVATGWPGAGSSIDLADVREGSTRGWFVALAVVAAGLLLRRSSATVRGPAIGASGVIASIAIAWTWPEPSALACGLLRGSLTLAALAIGRSLRPVARPVPTGPGPGSTASRWGGIVTGLSGPSPVVIVLGLGLGFGAVGRTADLPAEAPILALLPFDGPADPRSEPHRVVLLLKDFHRLELLARPAEVPATSRVALLAASHQVGREGPGMATVESEYDVEVDGPVPATWTFPVGPGRELSATVDDRPTPLAIAPDGRSAIVPLAAPGGHRLRFRRSVSLGSIGAGGQRAAVPIARAAFATVAVSKGAGGHWVEVPGAAGRLSAGPGGIDGGLGPLDVLEVRWFPEDRPAVPSLKGPVESACLWDARPSGDLFRVKLTHADPEGASEIRLTLGAGLVVRRCSIPGMVATLLGGTEEQPEWIARFDPPLPPGEPAEVEFWRAAYPGMGDRRWPGIAAVAGVRSSMVLGFRRPGDWSGRLGPAGDAEAVSDAGFAQAWGTIPTDDLTPAGAVRLGPASTIAVRFQPIAPSRAIRTRLEADLGPGRADVAIEATVVDRQGRTFELELGLPADFRITRVESAGLVDWQKLARDRLRLQFDGSESPGRVVRIEGFLAAPAEALLTETRAYQARIPWPRWSGASEEPGTLVIVGPVKSPIAMGEGVVPIGPAAPPAVDGRSRSTFRVDDASGLWPVRWTSPAARVAVAVRSEFQIEPDALEWSSDIICDVSGGPADTLNFNLPTEWAGPATLEIDGMAHRLVSDARGTVGGTTQWTIVPDAPIWGRARLHLRSRRALRPGVPFSYPQLAPLAAPGRGSVSRYDLAVANVSGRALAIVGTSGLRPIEAARFRSEEPGTPSRPVDRAFRVTGERWALTARVGREGEGPGSGTEAPTARVALARLDVNLAGDGATWGVARYDLASRPGPFLAVRLPESAEILWASVDGRIGPAIAGSPGLWSIPLGDRGPRRVCFAWHRAAIDGPAAGQGAVALPSSDGAGVPTLLSIAGPASLDIGAVGPGVEAVGRAGWEVANVEPLARSVTDDLEEIDRGDPADRERLVDDLVEIELRARALARAEGTDVAQATARLQVALAAIAEASQAAGQDALIEEARARVGLAQPFDDPTDDLPPRSEDLARVVPIGPPRHFRVTPGGPGTPVTIVWTARSPARGAWMTGPWPLAFLGAFASIALGASIARPPHRDGRLALGAGAVVALGLVAWVPAIALAGLGLIGIGRLAGKN